MPDCNPWIVFGIPVAVVLYGIILYAIGSMIHFGMGKEEDPDERR